MELIRVNDFISVKSHKAKGKRLSTYQISSIKLIEHEDEQSEDENVDIIENPVVIADKDEVDYKQEISEKAEPSDAGFLKSSNEEEVKEKESKVEKKNGDKSGSDASKKGNKDGKSQLEIEF